ncbi:LysR family transcriptional regulator [Marinobacterium rhizophilum]|uniref:LysR family transcriptional regulator n=1 Tax=Marinobacterium rhizophilum TaxID=420402 RepID=A0ABY5HL41_9GAMM|nr:LysR family transcriptional regulator [Marinobacterium rhizophilum]UTW13107.1 LysR family transcriptional regulator [Marinobacterium rhizophilum]
MSFDLKSLELFVRVASLGAIGRAGAEFNLSATNTTQRLKMLEVDLGVKLLNRTTRAVSLTPDGETLLEHARRILEDVEAARNQLSQTTQSVSGTLRVTASASFGRSHIVPFVPEFLRLYPGVTLDLHLTDTVVDIVEMGFDLAFRIGDLAPSSLLARKIDDNPMQLVASPDYLARAGTPALPQDLAQHACLPLGDTRVWKLLAPDGTLHESKVSGPVSVNLGEALGEWVLAGLGIGLASLWYAGPDIAAGRLVPVMPEYRVWPEAKIWAVRPPGRIMPARVKAFLDFMQARIIETNSQRYASLLDEAGRVRIDA